MHAFAKELQEIEQRWDKAEAVIDHYENIINTAQVMLIELQALGFASPQLQGALALIEKHLQFGLDEAGRAQIDVPVMPVIQGAEEISP